MSREAECGHISCDRVLSERDDLLSTVAVQRTRLMAASEALDHLAAFLDHALPGRDHSMSTPTREPCPKCDVPRANDWDWQFGMPNASICWGGRFQPCCNPPVDWRARCLQAESALALMSAPLSPEVLQAITEEITEESVE